MNSSFSFNSPATSSNLLATTGLSSLSAPLKPIEPPVILNTHTSTTQSSGGSQQMNFCQLEEIINKWTHELEEQEKTFTNQATEVNAWDKILLNNGEKIVELNRAVEKVKTDQEAMDQELEFISAQHSELVDIITPLEQELLKIPQVDVERGQTYIMAETLDSQLKQMSEDLKEVIEHLNEANKFSDPNDPMVQIGKILNAHMNTLSFLEGHISTSASKLDEIAKMHEVLKRGNERRGIRLTYYDN